MTLDERIPADLGAGAKDMWFCDGCDYAISADQLELSRVNFGCPRCGKSFDMFYGIGSRTHRERREAWERGETEGSPPPLHRVSEA
jgi:predicted RNA-binding Zn-ribbon protein involved in translation (DUF1610 family)